MMLIGKNAACLYPVSHTHEWMQRHLVGRDADRLQPWPYQQPTWVFSSRALAEVPGADIRFANGDVKPVYEQMVKWRAARTSGSWAAET